MTCRCREGRQPQSSGDVAPGAGTHVRRESLSYPLAALVDDAGITEFFDGSANVHARFPLQLLDELSLLGGIIKINVGDGGFFPSVGLPCHELESRSGSALLFLSITFWAMVLLPPN